MTRTRRIQNGVLAAAIAAELLFLIGHFVVGWGPSRRRPATTPPALTIAAPEAPPARVALRALAARAARLRPARQTGRYAYAATQSWSLDAQTRAGGHPDHPLFSVTESWRAADGSGSRISVRRTADGFARVSQSLPAGAPAPPRLTGDQVAIAHRLHLGYPSREPVAEQFAVFAAVYSAGPVPPSARASMLRLLARVPGLVDEGIATDRLGRRGTAIALTSSYTGAEIQYVLVFDPRTGGLLESDRTLTGDPGKLDVASGSPLAYTAIRGAGRTGVAGRRPARITSP